MDGPSHAAESSRAAPLAALIVFAVTAVAYLATMCRTVGFIDRGELAAVATTLGIAHPTGYPTFTLLGHLVTRVVPLRPVLALNALAALWVAASAAVLVLYFARVLAQLSPPRARRAAARSSSVDAALAGLAALVTALSITWWQQANGYEVYALHTLLVALVAWTFLRWMAAESAAAPARPGDPAAGRAPLAAGRWFALVTGLACTNHLTLVTLAPALALHTALVLRSPRLIARRLAMLAPAFLLGLLPYLYLPLRAAQNPRFEWGSPDRLDRFLAHVTGRQYQVWWYGEPGTFGRQTAYFFSQLPAEWAHAGLVLVGLGAVLLARRAPRLGLTVLVMFTTAVLVAGGYAIRDLGPYYLPAHLGLGTATAAGLCLLRERFGSARALGLGGAVVALALVLHWRVADERPNRMVEAHVQDLLAPLPPRALLLSTQWDYGVSAGYYFQAVEGTRRDVTVIDPELLRRSWYVEELARREPELAGRVSREAADFLREVAPFERGTRFDPAVIQTAYVGLIEAIVERAIADRPVFVTSEIDPRYGARFERVPYHLALWLRTEPGYVPEPFPRHTMRVWRGRVDPYVATLSMLYGQSLAARLVYETRHGHTDLARRYGSLALEYDPGISPERVPPLPLDGRELVLQSQRFFDGLRATLAAPRAP